MNDENWNALLAALGMTEAWGKLMADADSEWPEMMPANDANYQRIVASFGLSTEEFSAEMLRRMDA